MEKVKDIQFAAVVITYVTRRNQGGMTTLNNGRSHTWEKSVRMFERKGYTNICAIGVKKNNHTVVLRDVTDGDLVRRAVESQPKSKSKAIRRSGKTVSYRYKEGTVKTAKEKKDASQRRARIREYEAYMRKPKGLSPGAVYMDTRPEGTCPLDWWAKRPAGMV